MSNRKHPGMAGAIGLLGSAACWPGSTAGLAPDTVAATAVAFIVLSHRLARDPRWHPLVGNTLAAGVLVSSSCWSSPTRGPLHDVGRLVQRLTLLAVFFPCRLLLPARLLWIAGR